jgi:hypothetical protein
LLNFDCSILIAQRFRRAARCSAATFTPCSLNSYAVLALGRFAAAMPSSCRSQNFHHVSATPGPDEDDVDSRIVSQRCCTAVYVRSQLSSESPGARRNAEALAGMAGALALSYDAAFTRTSVTRGIVASAALEIAEGSQTISVAKEKASKPARASTPRKISTCTRTIFSNVDRFQVANSTEIRTLTRSNQSHLLGYKAHHYKG